MRRLPLSLILALTFAACDTAQDDVTPDPADAAIDEDGLRVILRGDMAAGGDGDPHVRMSPMREPAPGDRRRASRIVATLREALAPYEDVAAARRDGYVEFLGTDEEVHFVNVWRSFLERWRINPEEPGALLYRPLPDGGFRLVGAMFTAPSDASMDDLDRRVPLSQARWHLHVNLCVPRPIWDEEQWARTTDGGAPLFGPESPIATREACDAVGGAFHETMFGWMVHAYLDAADPWAGHHDGDHGNGHGGEH